MGTRITLLLQKPGLLGSGGRGRHAGPGQSQKLTAHVHLPSHPASRPGLCTFQKERSERREGAGAGAKAPGAAPLTLSEDGRLRRARWRLPCKKGHAESRGAEQERSAAVLVRAKVCLSQPISPKFIERHFHQI